MKGGYSPNEIASMLGYTARWIRTLVGRYNRAGEQAILDRRRMLPGAPCLPSMEQQQELDQALEQLPTDGGLWSGPKVAAWMQERVGRLVDPRRGWDYLQRLGRSSRVPRPQQEEGEEAEQAAPGLSRSQG
jgi:transposase